MIETQYLLLGRIEYLRIIHMNFMIRDLSE